MMGGTHLEGINRLSNLLHVCRFCHRYITEHPADAVAFGWACRSWMQPTTQPVLLARRGWTLLDELGHYLRTRNKEVW